MDLSVLMYLCISIYVSMDLSVFLYLSICAYDYCIFVYVHSEKILQYYSCIGGFLVAQNTVAEIWSNAW